jgi:multimeric flavodoxin WrbA
MKVLGLTCGRKMGNSEVLVREALSEARKVSGAEVEVLRLHDLNIKPCIGCEDCNYDKFAGGEGKCFIKNDDFQFLVDKVIESDGVILGSPCYGSRPPGLLMMINDRMMGASALEWKTAFDKPRPKGVISVGGSDMTGAMLPLATRCIFLGTKLVDQMSVIWTSRPGQVVLNEEAIARARKLGSNVAKAMKKPLSEMKYVGNEVKPNLDDYYRSDFDLTTQLAPPMYEACPVCHSDLVRLRGKFVECPACYMKGTIEVKDGVASFICDPVNRPSPYAGAAGKKRHDVDGIQMHNKLVIAKKEEIKEKLGKYQADIPYAKPASKK